MSINHFATVRSLKTFPETPDPAFLEALHTQLKLPADLNSQWLADTLAHRVARLPKNLRTHVQRVFLHQTENDSDALFAALLDLFIVLANRGLALRQRLLHTSENQLTSKQYEFLLKHLESGVFAYEEHPAAPRSRLSQGGDLQDDFIGKIDQQNQQDARPPIEQAQDFLNYGQLEQAQQVLEQALIENPDDLAVSQELAELYVHSKDVDALTHLINRLGSPIPDAIMEVALKLDMNTP